MNIWMKIISTYLIIAHLDSDTLKSENLDSYPRLDNFYVLKLRTGVKESVYYLQAERNNPFSRWFRCLWNIWDGTTWKSLRGVVISHDECGLALRN